MSLVIILINFYWVSMIESISSIKFKNKTEETPFGIPGASTEHDNDWCDKLFIERKLFSVGNRTVLLWLTCSGTVTNHY